MGATLDRAHFAIALARARHAADDPKVLGLRLTRPAGAAAAAVSRSARSHNRLGVASELLRLSRDAAGKEALQAAATAHLLAGEPANAVTALKSIPESSRDASTWNDLAAAHAVIADQSDVESDRLAALDAADRALALQPLHAEAAFNRAKIVEAFGVFVIARGPWKRALAADAISPWSSIVRTHLSAQFIPDRQAWQNSTANIDEVTPAQLRTLTRDLPQQARAFAEGPYLSFWADRTANGDHEAAQQLIDRARVIGGVLRDRGDSMVADAVEAIDRSSSRDLLVRGHLDYKEGRLAYARHDAVEAERLLRRAERSFAGAGSPMAAWARHFAAAATLKMGRPNEALEIQRRLLADERRAGGTHKALMARIQLEIALAEAVQGHWSASLDAAAESVVISRSLGERGNVAAAEAILCEDYDFVGQAATARRHCFSALRNASAAGDLDRVRVILAALSRTELRGHRWTWARAVQRLEAALIHVQKDDGLDADLFLRDATAESHLGNRRLAAEALLRARASAVRIAANHLRYTLLSDIDAVEGMILRRINPRRSATLLTSAIAYQKHASRPILLPELHLARGRIHLASGALEAAHHDFDEGIRELERQRTTIRDAEIRPGIFDDASDLFEEAVALHLHRNDPATALAYVERGRARTALEQIEDADAPPIAPLAEVQRRLAPGAVLLEYVALTDRLVIFVITQDHLNHRIVLASRDRVAQTALRFVDALSERRDDHVARAASVELHELVIEPIRAELSGVRAVTIVADDVLQRVPFAALLDPRSGAYLIERVTLATAPSASIFAAIVDRLSAGGNYRPASALIYANPLAGERYPSLHVAEAEAREAARNYQRSDLLAGKEATAARFTAMAASHQVIYFAGHAVVDKHEPARSALICASGDTVTSRQIAQLKLSRHPWVVLAACSTMTGRNAAVEGVSSLSRAFLVAGASAVIGTLWDIDDREAAPLVTALHKHLSRGVAPSEALRAAQLEALGGNREIRRWAAFAVLGAANHRP